MEKALDFGGFGGKQDHIMFALKWSVRVCIEMDVVCTILTQT